MKIRDKLFLILLSIVVGLMLLTSMIVLGILQNQAEREKLNMYYDTMHQAVFSFGHMTDDVELYVFDRCRSEEISMLLTQENTPTRSLILRNRMDAILAGSPYLVDGFFVDLKGKSVGNSAAEQDDRFQQLLKEGHFETNRDILWMMDHTGELYLRRSLYQLFPYLQVGYAVFRINRQHMIQMIGRESSAEGDVCIINAHGDMILMTDAGPFNYALFEELVSRIRSGEILPQAITFRDIDYRIIAVNGSGDWHGLFAVKTDEMLHSFYRLRRIVLTVAIILIFFSAVLSFLSSNAFTRHLRKLKHHVTAVSGQQLSYRIPPISNDEIGDLARAFNALLERLEHTHNGLLEESRAREQARYELLEFRYQSLQNQVSPHFLCNILSTISVLAMTGENDRIEELAIEASRYLRSNLHNNYNRFSTVSAEVQMAANYVSLVNSISAVQINLVTFLQEGIDHLQIPNMILQPLVENSIKHGIPPGSHQKPFTIELRATMEPDGKIRIVIHDSGVGYSEAVMKELALLKSDNNYQPTLVGFGTAGVIHRLQLQYDDQYTFMVENHAEGGAVTTIILPNPENTEI